ncbi:putative DNA-binding bromodomain-containing protein [Heracleum sosnowskyi]|uniref:DNA-binding bromodomain-containing protein n=1 Tax=Heracleum sosnowskyi TaxID=360622 RepID=A0AAD8H9G1_9APIA|nr:putative DNA-binding bromodomain-containing protein [Heracleum sosnowskyi]
MGKVSSPTLPPPPPPQQSTLPSPEMNKPKKKKGRPSLKHQKPISPNLPVKSTHPPDSPSDDDDERQQKKVKLVVRLPQSSPQQHFDSPETNTNNIIITSRSADGDLMSAEQQENVGKATDTLHGSSLETGPTTPLLDKKLLVFILDRLQKKDTYGVFSEPVDPNELPDYNEIIEHPMDFGTVRRKLDAGLYSNLEQLEADVLLICSNAMQYNSSDTVYFRQARSIQELAKRDFENLRHEGDDGELRPKVVRRGRPPSKHLKKPPLTTSISNNGPETSSALAAAESPALAAAESPALAATESLALVTAEENTNGSSAYNLRRAPVSYKFQTTNAALSSHRSRNGGNYSEWLADWNDEFPGYILRADMKYGKKLLLIDETRRETYKQFHPTSFGHEPSLLSDFGRDTKQLMPVGLHMEHSYARSVARFAANLGPVVWNIASKKLASVLPPGVKFGPGYVGEREAPTRSLLSSFERQKSSCSSACEVKNKSPVNPSTSGVNPVVASGFQDRENLEELNRRISCQNESAVSQGTPLSGIRPGQSFHTPNKTVFHAGRNGLNGVFGCSFPSQMGLVLPEMAGGHSGLEEASQLPCVVPKSELTSPSALADQVNSEEHKCVENETTLHSGHYSEGKKSLQAVSSNPLQSSEAAQPDLNVRLQAPSSPNSGFRVVSPQQPDLALQL